MITIIKPTIRVTMYQIWFDLIENQTNNSWFWTKRRTKMSCFLLCFFHLYADCTKFEFCLNDNIIYKKRNLAICFFTWKKSSQKNKAKTIPYFHIGWWFFLTKKTWSCWYSSGSSQTSRVDIKPKTTNITGSSQSLYETVQSNQINRFFLNCEYSQNIQST